MTDQENIQALLGEESTPVEFAHGLIGLLEWRRFVLVSHPAGGALKLLQSLENDRVSFIVVAPQQIVSDYQFVLSKADAQALQLPQAANNTLPGSDNLDVYCILSVQEEPFNVTANLLGPLVFNWQAGQALQVVLTDSNSSYSARHLVVNQPSTQSSAAVPVAEEA